MRINSSCFLTAWHLLSSPSLFSINYSEEIPLVGKMDFLFCEYQHSSVPLMMIPRCPFSFKNHSFSSIPPAPGLSLSSPVPHVLSELLKFNTHWFPISFFCSFNKNILSACYISSNVMAVQLEKTISLSLKVYILMREKNVPPSKSM